jgi:hypothetical protein
MVGIKCERTKAGRIVRRSVKLTLVAYRPARDLWVFKSPVRFMMRVVVTASVLLTAGCSTQQTPTTPSVGVRVSGRVLDFTTGLGVSGATVVFGNTAVTNAGGSYAIIVPAGSYEPLVDGVWMGQARVRDSIYRGDLLVRSGLCVSRYGTLTDARTQRPVVDATVSLAGQSVRSGFDGWYRIDLGCTENGLYGFNTTFIYVSHPNYVAYSQVVGRGVYKVSRLDLELDRR